MTAPDRRLQFCSFYLNSDLFGIDVLRVQEVMRQTAATPVALAPQVVTGLMNLRGSIVSCIDLRLRFGMPPAPSGTESVQVITHTDDGLVSFLVDRIGDVLEPTHAAFEPPPGSMRPEKRMLIDGIYKLDGCLLTIINVNEVVKLDEISAQ